MTIALVGQNTGSGASAANATVTITATTVGNFLLAVYDRSGGLATGALTSVTDSAGQTWTLLTRGAVSGGTHSRVEIWCKVNSASITSVTFNSGTAQTNSWNITEWSGVATAAPLDVASPDNSANVTSTSQTTPSITTVNSRDLIVVGLHFQQTTTTDPSTPWINLTHFDDGSVGSGRAAYQIVSSTGAYSATWTLGVTKAAGVFAVSLIENAPRSGSSLPVTAAITAIGAITGNNGDLTEAITVGLVAAGQVGTVGDATRITTVAWSAFTGLNRGAMPTVTTVTISAAGVAQIPGLINISLNTSQQISALIGASGSLAPMRSILTVPSRWTHDKYVGGADTYGLFSRMVFAETSVGSILRTGGAYRHVYEPGDEELSAATEVYIGGRSYSLTAQQATDLTAAGYGAFITVVP